MTIAVGFSPRTAGNTMPRRVATLEIAHHPMPSRTCVATRRPAALRRDRGLKPTATIVSSLRDEIQLRSICSDLSIRSFSFADMKLSFNQTLAMDRPDSSPSRKGTAGDGAKACSPLGREWWWLQYLPRRAS